MKIRNVGIALVALACVPAAWAQTNGSAAGAPSNKIGVMNFQVAIGGSAEGKQAAAELQSQFTPRQNELDTLQKQIQDIQNRLRNGSSTLSDDEKARLQREGETMARSLQRKQQDLQDDLQSAQQDVVNRIGRKLVDLVDKYAKDNGYSVVLDTSSQNTVVFAANQVDITQELIKLYDEAYPVKGSAPATSRPSGGATRPAPSKPAPTKPASSNPPPQD
ncbi:MAG: OmpH family outer membrane protein [Candidatus Acidiferrales bacterium]